MTELQQQDQSTIEAFPAGIKLSEGDFATYANLFALQHAERRARKRVLGTDVEALQNAVLHILFTRTYEREFKDYGAFACWLERSIHKWSTRISTETIDIAPPSVPGRSIRRRRPVRQQPVDSDSHYDPAVELTDTESKRRVWNLRKANVHFDIAAIRSLSSSIRGVTRRSYHGQQNGVPYRGCGGNLPEISPRDLNFSLCIRYGIETLGSMQGGLVSFNFPTRDWRIGVRPPGTRRIVPAGSGLPTGNMPACSRRSVPARCATPTRWASGGIRSGRCGGRSTSRRPSCPTCSGS